MSVLVVGMSHNSAPVALLETVALSADDVRKLAADVVHTDHVTEATVIATCNRVEIYAEVDRFHGSVEDVSRLLVERANSSIDSMLPHIYVHYDDAAVSHLFRVAAGLDSMAVGEAQILGQTRHALQVGQEQGTVGPALNTLFQQALRVGKRSHAETDIDRAAPSLVSASLVRAEKVVGPVEGQKVVVVGAGGMAGLAAATVSRLNPSDLVIVNRTRARADSLAKLHGGRAANIVELATEIADAAVVIACAGARGVLITAEMVGSRTTAFIDLALPHDIDPGVADVEGATLIGLATLAEELHASEAATEVEAVRGIVAQEVTAFLGARQQAAVTPTVVALRSMATSLVEAEMDRLDSRLPDLAADVRGEVLQTVRRVVDKLLHEPTVRVKELANQAGGVSYERALAELFALDPAAVSAVSRPDLGEAQ
ncbi:glutamyl-tRNA reductase [Nocardioides baekrokdamisoli]|uniref:Glutamyl-tRNA reductase n=1 Tax=Nocardioides baekrokdamisoli TaxID=1804624 RepID=A0A3G9J480_9ACTN|nr:glutamyl-tRNA reductase [Nocardioides baekrokdamisoli]BBH17829.1 glutamyl-tRNA reductase [Nocardioides baekrokdamisoli]